MTIWELVEEALSGLGVPVAANIMLSETGEALPDVFLVYSLVSGPPLLWGDDYELMRYYRMQVNTYSRDGLADLPEVTEVMVAAGFTVGPIRELPYNKDTRHFGLAQEFVYTTDSDSESESY